MISGSFLWVRVAIAAALGSLTALLIGCLAPGYIDNTIHRAVVENIVWRPDSPPEVDARYRGLTDPHGQPLYFRVWLFNITNLDDVRRGAKPRLAEVGPLTYIKHRIKVEARWDRKGRVAVKEWDYHIFRPDLSAADPNATIVTLNLPLLGVLELLHAYSASVPSVRALLDVVVGILSGWGDEHVDGLFLKRTAGELLWGYEDLLLKRLAMLLGPTFVRSTTVQLLPNDTSAEHVLATQNASLIDTGWRPSGQYGDGGDAVGRRGGEGLRWRRYEYDIDKIWNMEEEAGWTAVTSWGPNCTEAVRGTDAFQFRPGVDPGSRLRVWITELFRSAELTYLTDVELYGIRMLRFQPDTRESEPDACHHQHIRGLANVTVPAAVGPNGDGSSEAAHGAPILLSLPHYCQVDPAVGAALQGLACVPDRHDLFVDVEPITGATMSAAKRLQLSSQLTDASRAVLEPTIGTSYILPVFWAEEASQISAAQAAAFRRTVYRAQRVAVVVRRVSYPTAAALAAAALATGLAAVLLAKLRPEREPAVTVREGVAGNYGGPGEGGSVTAPRISVSNGTEGRRDRLEEAAGRVDATATLDGFPGDGGTGGGGEAVEGGDEGNLRTPLLGSDTRR